MKCSPDTGNIIIMFWMGCFEYWRESWRQGTGVCGRADKRLNKKSKWMGRANGNNWNERVTRRNYNAGDEKKSGGRKHTCKQYMKQKHRGTVWTHGCFCRSDKRWECNVTSPDLVNLFPGQHCLKTWTSYNWLFSGLNFVFQCICALITIPCAF